VAKRDLLIEVGTEEMPAQVVAPAALQLKEKLVGWLDEQRIRYDRADWYGTPRRIAALVYGVEEEQDALNEEFRGPAKRIAVDENGAWTKAALGFARGKGVSTEHLFFREHKGETYVFARKEQRGQATDRLLKEGLEHIVTSLSFHKTMRWGSHSVRFVRPIRWLVALYGNEVIPVTIAGVSSGNVTYGHRFLGTSMALEIASDYKETLRRGYVIADPEERKQRIREELQKIADENGWSIPVERQLLEEVTYLVEYPTAVSGSFDPAFLEVPDDVLITSMREHQRYFPVKSQEGKLLPHFVTVRNGDDTSLDTVAKGNEKVLRARLADARFFYREDQKRSPSFFNEKLKHVVFHEKLGTVADKVRRIEAVARKLADWLGADQRTKAQIERTAELCKFDLETHMVAEFSELQGKMGEEYARIAGEEPEVAKGIFEHYLPRFAGDDLPVTKTGIVVGLADKIDTIAACFGIGIVPTGSQDPYALRRQAAGITQVILELDLPLILDKLFDAALDELEARDKLARPKHEVVQELFDFFQLRLKHILQSKHVRYDVIDAVLKSGVSHVQGVVAKAELLMERVSDPAFKRTVEAFTRVENLAAKAGGRRLAFNDALNREKAESQLTDAYRRALQRFKAGEENGRIDDMYDAIASMEDAIHTFFDEVMVMVDDAEIRANRLALLQAVSRLTRQFAHFNEIVFA
jgi:glycyl-tRNA synthetase beta chain